MLSYFLKGCLDSPAAYEALEDCGGLEVKVGAKKCLRITLAGRIAHQHPAVLATPRSHRIAFLRTPDADIEGLMPFNFAERAAHQNTC
jgi:hypothetical protein